MSRKDDVKLLFNFMIELLKEEETETKQENTQAPIESKLDSPKKLILDEKQEVSAKHILEVMKRAEVMDKMRSTTLSRPKLVPTQLRDVEEMDNEIITTHETENKGKTFNDVKNVLTDAKGMMDSLESKRPIVQSVPPAVLNETETLKGKNSRKRK